MIINFVPDVYKKMINPYTNRIDSSHKYYNFTSKGLFYQQINKDYLIKEIYKRITNPNYVNNNGADSNIIVLFKHINQKIPKIINDIIDNYSIPNDVKSSNTVANLNKINKQFILETSKLLINNYTDLDPELNQFKYINPDTGLNENILQGYNAKSYFGGEWHPEDLFINNSVNISKSSCNGQKKNKNMSIRKNSSMPLRRYKINHHHFDKDMENMFDSRTQGDNIYKKYKSSY
jgi:hypothetical protein